jgi:dynein light chain 1, axonemal
LHAHRLEVLSLARNILTRIEGLEPVSGTLQELWLSYNQVIKLTGLEQCAKLRVLYLANNLIRDSKELECVPPSVEEISLVGNPLWEVAKAAEGSPSALGCAYRIDILRRLPNLKKLDGVTVDMDERAAARKAAGGAMLNNSMGQTTRSAGSAGSAEVAAAGDGGAASVAAPQTPAE